MWLQYLRGNWRFTCTCERCQQPRADDKLMIAGEASMSKQEKEQMVADYNRLMGTGATFSARANLFLNEPLLQVLSRPLLGSAASSTG